MTLVRVRREWAPFAALISCMLAACGGSSLPAGAPKAPAYAPKGESKCSALQNRSSPLIVEWPSSERARLESVAQQRLVVVEYKGCQMQTLGSCRANGSYRYHAITPKRDRMRIRNEDELYASIPIYAASFAGKLEEAGQLNVDMTIVGRYESDPDAAITLEGDCERATHVVTALTTGAFRFYSGAASRTSAEASFAGAGAGGARSASQDTLTEDGDARACSGAKDGDAKPPFGCGAVLRLEVSSLDALRNRARPEAFARQRASTSSGRKASSAATPGCPLGTKPQGELCVAATDRGCPEGTSFESGFGCVSDRKPSERYAIAGAVVHDRTTKLTWQRKLDTTKMSFDSANAFCAGLELEGTGWRLPTKAELVGLGENLPAGIDRVAFPPAIESEKTPVTASTVFYWTSTAHPMSKSMAFAARFGPMGAQPVIHSKSQKALVRCVRHR